MQKIKVVAREDISDFEAVVQKHLNDNFRISSTNCGIYQEPAGYSNVLYQAILLKEE